MTRIELHKSMIDVSILMYYSSDNMWYGPYSECGLRFVPFFVYILHLEADLQNSSDNISSPKIFATRIVFVTKDIRMINKFSRSLAFSSEDCLHLFQSFTTNIGIIISSQREIDSIYIIVCGIF